MRFLAVLFTLCGSVALAQVTPPTAVSPAQSGAIPVPTLTEGQVWHLTVVPASGTGKEQPLEADIVLSAIVQIAPNVQGSRIQLSRTAPITNEIFSYTREAGQTPYFLLMRMGARNGTVYAQFCAVSSPHDRLNEPQTGVWGEGLELRGYEPIGKFLTSRVIGEQRTCTLTRTR
ncbi:hypothetical protein [Deinococcus sp. JMULE3]|uniref:hypothetical protein n=1 Tax=Deinococcus sp. JMULE3 TaxID=2518341 RepID=UPI0015768C0F|nr:hypothetical protein [Deinococcus sp. JMULE3]NTY00042.1 hypothetical protein [Deinococcus sp. JMULE3]